MRLSNYISRNIHIPKGSTDSTGIREITKSARNRDRRRQNKQERERERERTREREREREGQAGRQESLWQPQATQARSVVIASSLECRWRSQHDHQQPSLHFQPKLLSTVVPLRACCLLFLHSMGLIWVFLHLDIVARLPELLSWVSCVFELIGRRSQTILGALDLNDLGSGAGYLGSFRAGHYCVSSRKSSTNERNISR